MTFDTLTYARRLEKAGVPREPAEAHAEALAAIAADELATKRDLAEGLAGIRSEIRETELRLTIKVGAMVAAAVAIVAALIKLLP